MLNFFKEQREKLNISQREMATRLGVSNTAVSNWESADFYPTVPINKLAKEYEVSSDRMAKEVMNQRRAIEERAAEVAAK